MLFLNTNIKNKEQEIETAKSGKYTYIFIDLKLASTLNIYSLL